jgi:hypothetical protein
MGWFNNEEIAYLNKQIVNLVERVQELENNARYIADQPIQSYYQQSIMHLQNAFNTQPTFNEVPINDVVKAIVKHLDMQIEKVAEHTTKKPMEVKVVEKPKTTNFVVGNNPVTWEIREPLTEMKPKRKYTKRKTK